MNAQRLGPMLKNEFGGVYVANEGFDFASAEAVLAAREADAAAFGKPFLANPDLPRLIGGTPTLSTRRPDRLTDYPAMQEAAE